jgi:peptidoglycan hydrolase CwlO-like protein
MKRRLTGLLFSALAFAILAQPSSADWQADLNANLAEQARLQNLINDAKNKENTLASQIEIYNDQIKLTQLQVDAKQAELDSVTADITSVSGKITKLTNQLTTLSKATIARFRVTQAIKASSPFGLEIGSGGSPLNFSNLAYESYIEAKDKEIFSETLAIKNELSAQKVSLVQHQTEATQLRDSLASTEVKLANQKSAQVQLLHLTQNSEVSYQRQLAQAKAAQQTLLAFANARVGSGGSLLPHSSLADGWGKYYNQRDSSWGNVFIGYSNYQIWQVGCLITSVAMVWSHYGYSSTTPAIIGANPANFWGSTASMLIPGPVPPGHTATHVSDPDLSYLRSQLSSGAVVVAGISFNYGSEAAGYYPDHWIVLRGINSSGEFVINDPWYQNAMGVPLNYSHPDIVYNDRMIIEARVYR